MHQTTNVGKVAGDGCHPILEMNCFIAEFTLSNLREQFAMNHINRRFLIGCCRCNYNLVEHPYMGWLVTNVYNYINLQSVGF